MNIGLGKKHQFEVQECDNCDKRTDEIVKFVFRYRVKTDCSKCHSSVVHECTGYFCDLNCFFDWVKKNEIDTKGLGCYDCHETGWQSGVKSNGACDVCGGSGRIKKPRMVK